MLDRPLVHTDPTGHYFVDDIDVELTTQQAEDLIAELDWWINKLEGADDLAVGLEALGVSLEVLAAFGGVVPELGALGGASLFVAGISIDWTADDLKTVRLQLSIASQEGKSPVHLRVGANPGYWGVEINGEEVMIVGNVHPLFTPKGYFSGARLFLKLWHLLDYR